MEQGVVIYVLIGEGVEWACVQAGGGRLRADQSGCISVHAAKRVVDFRERGRLFERANICLQTVSPNSAGRAGWYSL